MKFALTVPVLPSVTVTSLMVTDGGGGGGYDWSLISTETFPEETLPSSSNWPVRFRFRPVNKAEAYEMEADYWASIGDHARAELARELLARMGESGGEGIHADLATPKSRPATNDARNGTDVGPDDGHS